MKNNYTYVFAFFLGLLFVNPIISQNTESYAISNNEDLLKVFKKQETFRIARIKSFLNNNPKHLFFFKKNSKSFTLYDIIDGKPIYKSTDNKAAGIATKTNQLHAGGSLNLNLDGSGMTVGVWDAGPAQNDHPEFANATNTGSRILVMDNTTTDGVVGPDGHGTHVTGTISAKGADPSALGMAPNVTVKSYNWTNDESEMVTAATTATNPILLSNHSYGVPIDQGSGNQLDAWYMGAYTQDAQDVDNIAKNNPMYLIVASAGNNGNTNYNGGLYAGYDKLTTDKNAKNNLVVANANPQTAIFTGELTNLVINSSSSQGPTDDLRIKPDIAADGTNLYSPVPTNAYATFTGTSMASPNTTGTLVLLQQYYNQLNGSYMKSSTLKGLVCHVSIDDNDVAGPDPKFGWGFLDAKASALTIANVATSNALISELSLSQNQTYTYTFSATAGDDIRASICWTDMPGGRTNTGDLNNQQPKLVNDLDLRLTKDGNTYFPWKLDYDTSTGFSNSKADNIVDNIERVDFIAPTSGVYTLTVTHKGILQGNSGLPFNQSQDYSLILTGNNLVLSTQDNKVLSGLQLYPNPSKGQFTVSFNAVSNDDVKIAVYDVSGKKLFNQNFTNNSLRFNETFNLSTLQSGVYIVNISEGNTTVSKKLIIE